MVGLAEHGGHCLERHRAARRQAVSRQAEVPVDGERRRASEFVSERGLGASFDDATAEPIEPLRVGRAARPSPPAVRSFSTNVRTLASRLS